jgi:zinc protease
MRIASLLLTVFLAAAAGQVKLPDYEQRTLDNGVVLQLLTKKDVPMVTLAVTVRGGGETDPADKAGLASVTADALRRGTESRSSDQFSEDLDFIGATFSSRVDQQSTYIVIDFLSKDFDRALELLADAVLKAKFPDDEVKQLLRREADGVRASKDSPRAVTGRYFREFFYPSGHPYSRQVGGDELTLERITPADLVEYHRARYTGKNLIVTAVGDLDSAAGAKIEKAFGSVGSGKLYDWVSEVPALKQGKPRLLLVDKPQATQTYFMIGQPGIHRTHPDRAPMILVNTLFGGRFTSMLNDELRVNAGLTYGAFSMMEQPRLQGSLTISTFTGIETTEAAVDLALEVLKQLNEKGIDEEQLASAKAYVKGRFPTRTVETSEQLAGILSDLELFSLTRERIDGYFGRIDAVTLEQANAIIKKRYRLDNLQFVLVGDASKIKDVLGKYAEDMTVIPVTKPGFRAE